MNEVSQVVFDKYQARKTKKQKAGFINYYTNSLSKVGIEYRIEGGGLLNHKNIVIGNLKKAQLVFTAHYDTAPKRILPMPYFIIFPNKIFLSNIIEILYLALFFAIPTLLGLILGMPFGEIINFYPFLIVITVLTSFIGPTNYHTANDNTSGVIAINEMIFDLKENLDNVAFVLFDNEEKGLLGSGAFFKTHKSLLQDKIIINLDCISDGDYLMVMPNKELEKNTKLKDLLDLSFSELPEEKRLSIEKLTYYPSDQLHFVNSIGIVACNNSPRFGRYLSKIHTSKDTELDQQNIEYIKSSLINLVNKTENIKLIEPPKKLNFIDKYWRNNGVLKLIVYLLLIASIGYFGGYFFAKLFS